MAAGNVTAAGAVVADGAQWNIVLKAPKLVIGPLEVGWRMFYTVKGEDGPLLSVDRIAGAISLKDIWLRGKLVVQPQAKKLEYRKKLRVPYLNTEVLQLRATADFSHGKGLLGHCLGVQLHFNSDALYKTSFVRKSPDYALKVAPRLMLPQAINDKLRMAGRTYIKANATVRVADAPRLLDTRVQLDLQEVNLVARLYDVDKVKPPQFSKRLCRWAWKPIDALMDSDGDGRQTKKAAKVVKVIERDVYEPDVIDHAANKAREWAHAILVNTCVANAHLARQWDQLVNRQPAAAGAKQ